MKVITTAIAALAIIGSLATAANAQERRVTTRTVVTHGDMGMHRGMHRGRVVKKVIVRRDRGMHRGWENRRGGVVRKKVIIER